MVGTTTIAETAQGVPSGGTTPWVAGTPTWQQNCMIPGASGHIANSGDSAEGTISGTVSVRVSWKGSGTAPNHVWLLVSSAASWSGDTGEASNGQNDAATAIQPGPGGISSGKHILRKSFGGQPIEFDINLNASFECATLNRNYSHGAGLNVSVSDRWATLNRADGGVVTLADNVYTGHTLLSWTGTHDGVNYSALPDGAPGLTTQNLNGVAGGAWNSKQFINPQTLQPYTTLDLLIKWAGSTSGQATFTPPAPLEVTTTTYDGQMPLFDLGGDAPKQQTWKYVVKDNQDNQSLELEWKWIAHYAHENWESLDETSGGAIVADFQANLSESYQAETFPLAQSVVFEFQTIWIVQQSPGFDVMKYHIGDSIIREEFGDTKSLEFDVNNPAFNPEVVWDGNDGTYHFAWVASASQYTGLVDVWNKKGEKKISSAQFAPASSALPKVSKFMEPTGGL